MHSFVSCLMHCVWSTKERRRLVTPELQERLYPYLGGIARENKMKALAVGGVEDHLHMLLSVPSTLSIAKAIQLLKGNSSSGFTKRFPIRGCLNGRKVTGHSALAYRPLRKRLLTSRIRNSIIVRAHSRTN